MKMVTSMLSLSILLTAIVAQMIEVDFTENNLAYTFSPAVAHTIVLIDNRFLDSIEMKLSTSVYAASGKGRLVGVNFAQMTGVSATFTANEPGKVILHIFELPFIAEQYLFTTHQDAMTLVASANGICRDAEFVNLKKSVGVFYANEQKALVQVQMLNGGKNDTLDVIEGGDRSTMKLTEMTRKTGGGSFWLIRAVPTADMAVGLRFIQEDDTVVNIPPVRSFFTNKSPITVLYMTRQKMIKEYMISDVCAVRVAKDTPLPTVTKTPKRTPLPTKYIPTPSGTRGPDATPQPPKATPNLVFIDPVDSAGSSPVSSKFLTFHEDIVVVSFTWKALLVWSGFVASTSIIIGVIIELMCQPTAMGHRCRRLGRYGEPDI